jgi:hypothetical protein
MANMDEFNIGKILSTSWSIFVKNIVTFGLTSVILLALPIVLLFAFMMPGLVSNPTGVGSAFAMQIPTILQMILQIMLMGAITYGTYAAIDGQTLTPQALVSHGLKGILPLLGITVIFVLVMIPSAFLLFIPFIIVACIWWVAVPVAIVEKAGVIGSLKRSAELTKDARMRIFGLMAIYVLVSLIAGAISLAVMMGGSFSMAKMAQSSLAMMTEGLSVYLIVSQIVGALIFAFICVVIAVCYAELRRIKDGVNVRDVAHIFS